MIENTEIWKDIDGYEGYQVSNLGRVRSLDRIDNNNHPLNGVILKPYISNSGYLLVGLYKQQRCYKKLVHRLVAEAFIPNPDNKPEIDHINTIKTDNTVFLNEDGSINYEKTNLRWTTRKENINNPLTKTKMQINARKPSKGKYGKKHHRSKPIIQYDKDGNFIREWDCANDVERVLGISNKHIGSVCLGKRKSCGGYIWKYKKG